MIWLTWRQFRGQAVTAVVVLAAAAIGFLVSGLGMHHAYATGLVACVAVNACGDVVASFQHDYSGALQLVQLLVIAAPALIGIFWGAPLIGREFESGTDQLAWNQSVTRTRWLAVKLAGVGLAAVITAGLLSYLLTWWAGPLDHITGDRFAATGHRFAAMTFASRGIVPIGYAAFAFALGATVGLVLRRTVPAMAVTLAVFIGVQVLMPTVVRPHLLGSTTTTFGIDEATVSRSTGVFGEAEFTFDLPIPAGSWVLSAPPVEDSSGQAVSYDSYPDCFGSSDAAAVPSFAQMGACLARFDLHETVTYQPPGHYWPLQWYETGIFLALAGALSGTCFWWIRRRRS
jgi:hypothetical protein